MRTVVLVAGLFVIAGAFTVGDLIASKRNAQAKLQAFANTVPAPLTADVREWLGPQLARRSTYPAVGGVWGLIAATICLHHGWQEVPWYWFAVAIGTGFGTTAGALVAGYRTVPLIDGPMRTVDPVRRRVPDYFDRSRVLRMRLAVGVSLTAFALAGAIAMSTGTTSARRALLGCGLGALLVLAHYWVTAAVIARPIVTSTPEGLLWQKALIAKTVEPMLANAFLVALFSAAIALFASVVDYRDLPLPVLLFGACVALVAAASAAAAILSDRRNRRDRQRSLMQGPSERTAP